MKAPNGSPIIGALERVPGVALISSVRKQRGKIVFQYDGETEMDWDSQEPVLKEGERVFVADDGREWRESELLKPKAKQ